MTDKRNAWGASIFCDDIRHEVAGKLSLVGVYGPDMVMPGELPTMYPKLGVFVTYYEMVNMFFDNLSLRISIETKDGENVIQETMIDRKDFAKPRVARDEAIKGLLDPDRVNVIRIPMIFSPFSIPGECLVKVRMHCGDVTTKLGVLWIRQISPKDNIQFS